MTEPLPFIDEHSRRIAATADVTWLALLQVLRNMGGSAGFARLLGCDPDRASPQFVGQRGDAVPGFRVAEAEPGARLLLRGRHRFADYTLTFILEGGVLHAQTHARFPGLPGHLYRAAVIGSGGHRIVTRGILRRVERTATA